MATLINQVRPQSAYSLRSRYVEMVDIVQLLENHNKKGCLDFLKYSALITLVIRPHTKPKKRWQQYSSIGWPTQPRPIHEREITQIRSNPGRFAKF